MNFIRIAAIGAAMFFLGISVTIRLLAWMSARCRQDPIEQWLFRLAMMVPFTLAVAFSLLAVLVEG